VPNILGSPAGRAAVLAYEPARIGRSCTKGGAGRSVFCCVDMKGDTMRRKDRLITDTEAFAILEKGEYGFLSTSSADHEPYGVPLHYCLMDRSIYFHCALEGRKINNMLANPRVSFCVVGKAEILPSKFSTNYESCIVQGPATESFGKEKQSALEGIVRKYSSEFMSDGLQYIDRQFDKTRVFKISIEAISGKARR